MDSSQTNQYTHGSYQELTIREVETLHWAAQGKTHEVIGEIMGISPRTARAHLEHCKEKLDASNVPHLIHKAWGAGILKQITVAFLISTSTLSSINGSEIQRTYRSGRPQHTRQAKVRGRARRELLDFWEGEA